MNGVYGWGEQSISFIPSLSGDIPSIVRVPRCLPHPGSAPCCCTYFYWQPVVFSNNSVHWKALPDLQYPIGVDKQAQSSQNCSGVLVLFRLQGKTFWVYKRFRELSPSFTFPVLCAAPVGVCRWMGCLWFVAYTTFIIGWEDGPGMKSSERDSHFFGSASAACWLF